jgi:H+/Cl- antiporter ClcA
MQSWQKIGEVPMTVGLALVVGLVSGGASAIFLASLDWATQWRMDHEFIIYALPIAGIVIGWLYSQIGQPLQGGHNLIIDTLQDGGPEIPARVAPLVLVGTILTHLFGGSAGREGAAVQISASLTDWFAHRLKISSEVRRDLLAAGVAGGFGSVFGTPVAGTIFGLEFAARGRLQYSALLGAFVAATSGDWVTRSLGIEHTHFPQLDHLDFSPAIAAKWIVFSMFIGAICRLFIECTHRLADALKSKISAMHWRMAVGGLAIVAFWRALGTSEYQGLGVATIERSFTDATIPIWAAFAKLAATSVTLASGFLGGEVTPLFFIGATLGNSLAGLLDLPLAYCAALGMIGLFAAASHAPLALCLMAVELFGSSVLPHVVLVAILATRFKGDRSIYRAQRPH